VKALICGAGIAGLALAQRLLSHGWEVLIVEHARGPRDQGYMLDFFGPGYHAAKAMGVLPRLKRVAYRIEEVAYVDRNGRRRAHLDYTLFARLVNGRLLTILRPDLETALREVIQDRVELRFGCSISDIANSPTSVRATLTDGSSVSADLLIGADGIHSTVRRLVFGPEETFLRYLGFHAAAYLFEDSEIQATLKGRFCLTDSANRLMGLYGLRDGRVATFCVHRTADPTLPSDPRTTLQENYASLGWLVPRALQHCPPGTEVYYDQVAQAVVPRWTRGRVVLVGDACQAVSLLAGQGAALAVAGAYVLGEHLATAPIDTALARYEQVWRPVIADKQQVARQGTEWFLPRTTAQVWARRVMLAAGSLPLVDRYVGAELLGKSNLRIADLTRQPEIIPDDAGSSSPGGARAMFARTPSPLLRGFFKAPHCLFRLGLGWLLGHRFLELTHRGRSSGRLYRTVLEVVHYDPRTQESVACSGWGRRADWYRNIIADPPTAVETGGRRYENPRFRELPPEENYPIVAEYVRRLPRIARPLAYRLGLDVRGSENQRRAHSEQLLLIGFGPSATGLHCSDPNDQVAPSEDEGLDHATATRARPETNWRQHRHD
jgi:deazaflavin-dependent oxidoreductase (nitroreductase family)